MHSRKRCKMIVLCSFTCNVRVKWKKGRLTDGGDVLTLAHQIPECFNIRDAQNIKIHRNQLSFRVYRRFDLSIFFVFFFCSQSYLFTSFSHKFSPIMWNVCAILISLALAIAVYFISFLVLSHLFLILLFWISVVRQSHCENDRERTMMVFSLQRGLVWHCWTAFIHLTIATTATEYMYDFHKIAKIHFNISI